MSTDARLDQMDAQLAQIDTQLTNVHALLLERLGDDAVSPKRAKYREGDGGGPLPINIKGTTLEEIQAFYHDCFLPPIHAAPFPKGGAMLEGPPLDAVLAEYNKDVSYAVVRQNSRMDKFVEHVAGVLGPQAAKVTLRRPVAFSNRGEYYQLMGYGVVDGCVLGHIASFFQYPPVASFIRDRNFVGQGMTNDRLFSEKVLAVTKLRTLWAEVVAYAVLLDMDLKEGRYVDRKRSKINMDAFGHLKKAAAAAFVDFFAPLGK